MSTTAVAGRSFFQYVSADGRAYFVPEDGVGEAVWTLPKNGRVVDAGGGAAAHIETQTLGSSATAAASGLGLVNPLYDPSAAVTAAASVTRRTFLRELTQDGREFFVPVDGGGDSVWELPADGEVCP